jgi:hypothetical protein
VEDRQLQLHEERPGVSRARRSCRNAKAAVIVFRRPHARYPAECAEPTSRGPFSTTPLSSNIHADSSACGGECSNGKQCDTHSHTHTHPILIGSLISLHLLWASCVADRGKPSLASTRLCISEMRQKKCFVVSSHILSTSYSAPCELVHGCMNDDHGDHDSELTVCNRLGIVELKKGSTLTRCIAILLIRAFYTSGFPSN